MRDLFYFIILTGLRCQAKMKAVCKFLHTALLYYCLMMLKILITCG